MGATTANPTLLQQLFGGLPKLVMFDLDGTLVDSVPGIAAAVDKMLIEFEVSPAGEDKVRSWVGNGQKLLVERALADAGIDVATNLDKGIEGFRKHYAHTSEQGLSLFPGVLEFLEFLKTNNVRMAVVTNKPIDFVPAILKSQQLEDFFEMSLGGECLAEKKPKPLPLLHTMEFFQVEAKDALMVGDSNNDLLAAEAALVKSLALTYGYNRGEDLSVYPHIWIGDNLSELCQ